VVARPCEASWELVMSGCVHGPFVARGGSGGRRVPIELARRYR
jgi:hypothetical protein